MVNSTVDYFSSSLILHSYNIEVGGIFNLVAGRPVRNQLALANRGKAPNLFLLPVIFFFLVGYVEKGYGGLYKAPT